MSKANNPEHAEARSITFKTDFGHFRITMMFADNELKDNEYMATLAASMLRKTTLDSLQLGTYTVEA